MARTWQGWVYIGVFCALFFGIVALPIPERLKFILLGIIGGVFMLDVLIIMAQLGKVHDERERLQQLIIERNCSFTAVFALVAAMGYQSWQHRHTLGSDQLPFDPLLVAVLLFMALVKFISTLYVRWKM